MSKELGELVVKECKADKFMDCDLIFSGLDSSVAGDIGLLHLWRDEGSGTDVWYWQRWNS